MRTSLWLLTSLFTVTLAGCSDDGSDSTTTTTSPTTMTGTGTDGTGTGTGTDGTGTTAEPTTEAPTTDATTSTTSTSTTSDTTTTTGGVELTCDAYCGIYATACVDSNEYDNNQACLDQCAQWPIGDAGAVDGDSLGCRLYHVTVASTTEPLTHCPHAGPSGAGVCVDAAAPTCADYCTDYFANCTKDLNLYANELDCAEQCAAWYPGTLADTVGDTVGCRLYHSGAAMADAATHCPHAGPGGGGVCVTQ